MNEADETKSGIIMRQKKKNAVKHKKNAFINMK